jgi:hypothetical protein
MKNVTRGVVDVFNLRRVAGYIGYAKTNHYSTEAETLNAAVEKMRDVYYRIASKLSSLNEVTPLAEPKSNFADWLATHKNRDSPLGDLARKRGLSDSTGAWPSFDNLQEYVDYLTSHNPPLGATMALERAWKSYKAFLKRKHSQKVNKSEASPTSKEHNPRTIKFVKNITPLHFRERTVESFAINDKAWISWDGKKAIPVTIVEVDERYYTFRIERPLKNAGNEHYLRLDEVRSTPELACINHVT